MGLLGRNHRRLAPLALAALLVLAGCGADEQTEQELREAAFAESMQNVVLVGSFTVTGRGDDRKLREERYEIEKAVKRIGDLWTIHARIQYGEHDVTAPVPVNLLWAGDTPVISLTDVTIPNMGTFTARVAFYRDHYSGMWWHGETGGNMFGRIVRE